MGGRRLLLGIAVAAAAVLSAAPAARASFHEILVREVFAGGAANDSYVVLQAYSGGQNFLSGHSVTAYDATGTAIGTFTFSSMVANGQNQMTVLVADSEYATGFPSGPAPDGTTANLNLSPAGGAVCWAGLDCMSWGSFSGATVPSSGSPADPGGIPAATALRRTIAPNCPTLLEFGDDSNVSATDFANASPSPRANSSAITETACPPAPDTIIGNPKPPIRTNSTEASFSFSASPAAEASFECRLDSAPTFTSCTSPASYTSLTGGAGTSHTFRVRAVHPTNGTDPTPATYTWTVDTVAPTTTIDTHPPASSPSDGNAFTFHASETSTFQCSLVPLGEPPTFSTCSSGKTYNDLANGEYTFEVRATDQATNVGAPSSYSWEVDDSAPDTTAPETTIDSKPPDPSTSATASFTYHSNEGGSSFECALDGSGFAACPAAGITYGGLANGPHSFQVRAIDPSANVDPTPAGYSFSVAAEAPAGPSPGQAPPPPVVPETILSIKPAAKTPDRTPSFRFRSATAGATFECAIDRQPFRPCRSPFTTKALKPGRHTFSVRARLAGLVDPSPSKWAFKILPRR